MGAELLTAADVAARIPDNATVALTGNASVMVVDHLLTGIETRFKVEGHPSNLTVYIPCNAGLGPETGVDRFAHAGLLKRYIASAFPVYAGSRLADMIMGSAIEAYNYPMGVLYALLREAAAGRPGLLTHVGLDTYVDPEIQGGRMNAKTTEPLVERMALSGRTVLFYKAPCIDVALLKATTADENGNLAFEREPLRLGVLHLASAAKANRGKVYAQVERLTARATLPVRDIVVPGYLVDGIVLAPDAPQSAVSRYDPTITGEVKAIVERRPVAPGPNRVIIARAVGELRQGWLANLGVGIPNEAPKLLWEANLERQVTFTTEHGAVNGIPNPLPIFGTHINVEAVLDPTAVFDMYSGGLLDATLLGMAQADSAGDVNVSMFGGRLMGCGGFIDITARTRHILFCGTLAASGADVLVEKGRVVVRKEGRVRKLIKQVEHRTFCGRAALARGQHVRLITERGLFRLTEEGWVLAEVAPGIDPDRDIAPMLEFPLRRAPTLGVYPEPVLGGPDPAMHKWLADRLVRADGA